jgi:hypothetical protein
MKICPLPDYSADDVAMTKAEINAALERATPAQLAAALARKANAARSWAAPYSQTAKVPEMRPRKNARQRRLECPHGL